MRFIENLRDTWDADSLEVTSDFVHGADLGRGQVAAVLMRRHAHHFLAPSGWI
jgi:hypothetical protein